MILHGNQRGGAKDLARHLLKDENDHVEVHELTGFVSDDLESALNEVYAISKGTKAKQFLYSLSLNPPATERASTEAFEAAIRKVEKALSLTGQPRAVVFHEKNGRRHCHAVWSRIDAQEMKAIRLPYTKRKLQELSRELFIEHGWKMPPGMMRASERDPTNFTMAEWQQAKRTGKDPRAIKEVFQDCWSRSDNRAAFANALAAHGYRLARGDRRGFVALDHRCEVFAVSKWVGIRTKAVREKLGDETGFPSVDETRQRIARDMAGRLSVLQKEQSKAVKARTNKIAAQLARLITVQKQERKAQRDAQASRQRAETQIRQARFSTGLRSIMDRVTGKYGRTRQQNERETMLAALRDQEERDDLIFVHLEQRRALERRIARFHVFAKNRDRSLEDEISQYHEINNEKRQHFDQGHRRSRACSEPSHER